LKHDDPAIPGQAVVEEILGNLGRFAGTGRGLDHDAVLVAEDAGEVVAEGGDGEGGGIQREGRSYRFTSGFVEGAEV
jgi:hypothetical protein